MDSDHVSYDARASTGLRLNEIAPGVQHVVGGTHNSLLVEMSDHLVAIDAPVTDWQSNWTIAAAKEKYPNKPIRYLVMTHHHMDHSGGMRAYLAQGATLVVGKGAADHYRKALAAPFTRNPDLAARNLGGVKIIEVGDKHVISDGKREVSAHLVENPHATAYLIGYVADARIAYVTDIYSPGPPLPAKINPALASVVQRREEGRHPAADRCRRPWFDRPLRAARRACGQLTAACSRSAGDVPRRFRFRFEEGNMNTPISLLLITVFSLIADSAGAASGKAALDTVDRAVQAMGGERALLQVRSVVMNLRAQHWEPQSNYQAGGEAKPTGESSIVIARDFGAKAVRVDWDRTKVGGGGVSFKYSEIYSDGVGIVDGADTGTNNRTPQSLKTGQHTMSGIRLASFLREQQRASPLLVLDMKSDPTALTALPDQTVGGKKLRAVRYDVSRYTFTVMFDPATGLPARVRSLDTEPIRGDVNYDLVLSDWRAVNGVQFAHQLSWEVDGKATGKAEVSKIAVNAAIPADRFAISAEARAAAHPACDGPCAVPMGRAPRPVGLVPGYRRDLVRSR